jgi:hypothetical protein
MSFKITGLNPKPFIHLYGLSDAKLAGHGAIRYQAIKDSRFPDRIEMREAKAGETLLLLNHTCQPASSPYHATHAIFVIEGELLSSLVFEGVGSCGDLALFCGFNSVFERDASDDFGQVIKAA